MCLPGDIGDDLVDLAHALALLAKRKDAAGHVVHAPLDALHPLARLSHRALAFLGRGHRLARGVRDLLRCSRELLDRHRRLGDSGRLFSSARCLLRRRGAECRHGRGEVGHRATQIRRRRAQVAADAQDRPDADARGGKEEHHHHREERAEERVARARLRLRDPSADQAAESQPSQQQHEHSHISEHTFRDAHCSHTLFPVQRISRSIRSSKFS